jgi:hypothetical protein
MYTLPRDLVILALCNMAVCVSTTVLACVLEAIGTKGTGAGTACEGEAPIEIQKGPSALLPGTLELV